MKLKIVRSFVFLFLAFILVIGGTTISWFTAEQDLPSAIEMVAGTLTLTVSKMTISSKPLEELENESLQWEAKESKKFCWTLENTGSLTSYIRARPESILTNYDEYKSAWGEGTPFKQGQGAGQGGSNRAMYFACEQRQVTLLAGNNKDVGTVNVQLENDKIKLKIQTKDGWKLIESYVHIAETENDFPTNGKGYGHGNQKPMPGKFDHKKYLFADSHVYKISSPESVSSLVAVHARLVKGTGTTVEDAIDWSFSNNADSGWKKGSDGWFYYCNPVEKGEEITLSVQGILKSGNGSMGQKKGNTCSVELQAEAVQATFDALEDAGWADEPCSHV